MTIEELLIYGKSLIHKDHAKMLLAELLEVNSLELLTMLDKKVSTDIVDKYKSMVKAVKDNKPIQYVLGNVNFYGNTFYVNENVLIPQPDTEISVETCLNSIKASGKNNVKILDLCTGSGAIAISLKKFLDEANIQSDISASDISMEALRTADENAKDILGKDEIKFMVSDLFDEITEKFDIIISNPPYIETDKIRELSKDVQAEPHLALDGGSDGLRFYRNIRFQVENFLNKGGLVILEIGYNQMEIISNLLIENGFEILIAKKDFAGFDRIIIAKRR